MRSCKAYESSLLDIIPRFPLEFEVTSSNKIRSRNDIQFAFSYFYYLMGVTRNRTAEEIFEELDTDHSG